MQTQSKAVIKDHHGIKIEKSVTIARSAAEIYSLWRDLEEFSRYLKHIKAVVVIDDRRSHWITKPILGRTFEWDSEILVDRPNEFISWRTLEGADVPNAGTVRFVDAPRKEEGTEVHVIMSFDPPAGKFGDFIAKLFGENPEKTIGEELERIRSLLETEEIPSIQGQSSGRVKGEKDEAEREPEHIKTERNLI
jgi:uncharacterized membrane protein